MLDLGYREGMSRLDLKAVGGDSKNRTIGLANISEKNVWNDLTVLLEEPECQPLPLHGGHRVGHWPTF